MIVLLKMAIVALHPFFQVNVRKVYGLAEAVRIIERDLLAIFVEPVTFSVVAKHRAKYPAMSMKIGELRSL